VPNDARRRNDERASWPRRAPKNLARRVAREEAEAHERARKIVAQATAEADAVYARVREEASRRAAEAFVEARKNEQGKLAAAYLALRRAEEERATRDLDRAVALALLLAERLIGVGLELEPSRVAVLARQALAEARGARRVVIQANPLDADALKAHLSPAGLDVDVVEVQVDAGLARGDLRLHTDIGTLDAKLTPRLERLASALRDLRHPPARS
jgi:flagellar biosynthesis/type III secretory pathway protein FliH